jgi:hypothetical protein
MKTCTGCNQIKNEDEFFKNKRSNDGLCYYCKQCDNNRKYERLRQKTRARGGQTKISTLEARLLRARDLKYCPRCKDIKSVEAFSLSGNSNRGRSSHCRDCSSAIAKERNSRIEIKEEKHSAYLNRKEQLRNNHLLRNFGITLEQYKLMEAEQGGVCAICGEPELQKGLAVDHCHKTDKVRALLCGRCNPAVGFCKDDPEIADRIAAYIRKYQ